MKKIGIVVFLLLSSGLFGMTGVDEGRVVHNAHTATKAFMKLLEYRDEEIKTIVKRDFIKKLAAYSKRESFSPLLEEGGEHSWNTIVAVIESQDKEVATELFVKIADQASGNIRIWKCATLLWVAILNAIGVVSVVALLNNLA